MNNILLKRTDSGMEGVLWSVMIPVFNNARLLKEALDSVVAQFSEVDSYEIWVVDDHSTLDDPKGIVEKYVEKNVKFYRQNKNVGQITNLNKCIELATGRLIHILHCDDRVLSGFYSKIESLYYQHPEAGAFFCRNNFIDDNGNLKIVSEKLREGSGYVDQWFEKIAISQLIQTPAMVVKKEVYNTIGCFNINLTWTEDWEMWVRISKQYPVLFVDEVLAEYRESSYSNSANSFISGRFIGDLKRAIDRNYEHHQSDTIRKKSMNMYAVFIIEKIKKMKAEGMSKRAIVRLLKLFFSNNFFIVAKKYNSKEIFKLLFK